MAEDNVELYRGPLPYLWTLLTSGGLATLLCFAGVAILTPTINTTIVRVVMVGAGFFTFCGIVTWRVGTSGRRWPIWATETSRLHWAPRLALLLLVGALLTVAAALALGSLGTHPGLGSLQLSGIAIGAGLASASFLVYMSLRTSTPAYLPSGRGTTAPSEATRMSVMEINTRDEPRWYKSHDDVQVRALGSVALLVLAAQQVECIHLAPLCCQGCGPFYEVPPQSCFALVALGARDNPNDSAVLVGSQQPPEPVEPPERGTRALAALQRNRVLNGFIEAGEAKRWRARTHVHRPRF